MEKTIIKFGNTETKKLKIFKAKMKNIKIHKKYRC